MKKAVSYLVVTAMLFAAVLTSCGKDDKDNDQKAKEFTVTFVSNGGSDVQSQTVKEGEKATKPSPDPTRSGFTFDAWYKEAALTAEWNFNSDIVTADVTLYAKWIQDEQVYLVSEIEGDEYTDLRSYTFEYDGQNRITKMVQSDVGYYILSYNNDGDLVSVITDYGDVTTYTKNGNKISIHYSSWDSEDESEEFELNAQGLLEKYTDHGSYDNGDWYTDIYTCEYQGENLVKVTRSVERFFDGENDNRLEVFNLTYDDKNSPFFNCKTPQWYLIWWSEFRYGGPNNPKSINSSDGSETIEYTYNDAGFPLTKKEKTFYYGEEFVCNYTFKYETKSASQQAIAQRSAVKEAQSRANVGVLSPKKDMERRSLFDRLGRNAAFQRKK